jgi:menaquinone-dependent protoporphyrinogen IX oxidase
MGLLILHQSKFGSAKLYAEWVREDLGGGEMVGLSEFDPSRLADFDRVVFVSSIYVGKVSAMDFMVKHWEKLRKKETYLVVVGNAPADSEESKQAYLQIPEEIRAGLKGYLKVPGKIDFQKIGFFYKLMLRFKGVSKTEDKMDRESLRPLIDIILGGKGKK